MAGKDLTAERLRELLHYDEHTGVFTRLVAASNNTKVGDVAGNHSDGCYVKIGVDGRKYLAHRLAWLYVHGQFPSAGLDHEDTIKHHNWIKNLRPATQLQNCQNVRRAQSHNKSGLLGVSASRGRWKAQIMVGGKLKFLGRFDTPDLAHQAYCAAKVLLHPFQTLVAKGPETCDPGASA